MSMLSLVQRFCRRTNIPVPATVLGSTDEQVVQVLALLEEEGNDLQRRGNWDNLISEATHTTTAAEDQGAITSIATNGFREFVSDTFWDRSSQLPVYVISKQNWQAAKATNVTGPYYQSRIRGGNLIVNPTPTAGLSWAFEYVSKNWITDSAGANPTQYFTVDSDLMLLDEEILMMGLRWRWKKEKGLEYAEDHQTYELKVAQALASDGRKSMVDMSNPTKRSGPGISTPSGSFPL